MLSALTVCRHLRTLGLAGSTGLLVGCGQAPPGQPGTAAPPPPAPATASSPAPASRDDSGQDSLYFDHYLLSHDGEGIQTFAYRPHPDSAWQELEFAVSPEVGIELDTANVDRAGEPELLYTRHLRRGGNRAHGEVTMLYVLRMGRPIDTLFTALVACEDDHHIWETGEYRAFSKTQRVTAGYGLVRVAPSRIACEQRHMPQPEPCRCDEVDLRDAGNPRFARPGLYRWQRNRLRWVAAR